MILHCFPARLKVPRRLIGAAGAIVLRPDRRWRGRGTGRGTAVVDYSSSPYGRTRSDLQPAHCGRRPGIRPTPPDGARPHAPPIRTVRGPHLNAPCRDAMEPLMLRYRGLRYFGNSSSEASLSRISSSSARILVMRHSQVFRGLPISAGHLCQYPTSVQVESKYFFQAA